MIIRCQNGRLLNADHVVEWHKSTSGENEEQRHTVTAKTILEQQSRFCRGHKRNAISA